MSVRRIERIGSRDRGRHERGVVGSVRERSDRVERRRQRYDTGETDQAVRRLEAGQSA